MEIGQLIIQAVVSVLTAVLASGGLWSFLSKKQEIRFEELERKRKKEAEAEEKNDVKTKLLVGMDRFNTKHFCSRDNTTAKCNIRCCDFDKRIRSTGIRVVENL